jgi:hypothetical protein
MDGAFELLDHELQVKDESLIVGDLGLSDGGQRDGLCGARAGFSGKRDGFGGVRAGYNQGGLERFDVVGKVSEINAHALIYNANAGRSETKKRIKTKLLSYPAAFGRQVCWGLLQSIPSSKKPSCPGESWATPSTV